LNLHTCVHIICTIFIFLPLSLLPPPQLVPSTSLHRTCSTLLFSNFVEEKYIKDKNRNMAFLLVWDKDSYTGCFLVLFPWICVLQLQLVHLFQSSSLLPSPCPWRLQPV
jgi:hypothetical protein